MYNKNGFEEKQLLKAIENSVRKGDVYEKLGYSRQPNGNVVRKIRKLYEDIGIDLTKELNPREKFYFFKDCPVCENVFEVSKAKERKKEKTTCSHSCANTYFKSGKNHPNWVPDEKSINYRRICFTYHDKKCVICDEEKIVTVHHYDENHNNNEPENLIPLCPTHHQYVHSRYKDEVQHIIDEYVEKRKIK